jgi:hypothetical protein
VTQGEDAKLTITGLTVTFADPKTAGKFVPLFSREIEFAKVVSKTPLGELVALMLKCEAKFFCHIFMAKVGDGDEVKATLMESVCMHPHGLLSLDVAVAKVWKARVRE